MATVMEYKLVLIQEILKHESEGWTLVTPRVQMQLGGWHSVRMVREVEA